MTSEESFHRRPPDLVWTPELDATLRQLWDSGLSTKRMGHRMGLTKNSVLGRVHRLKFPPRTAVVAPGHTRRAKPDHAVFLASLDGDRTE